jgi:pimeloyl-ACP methyl ester carboxylesterase
MSQMVEDMMTVPLDRASQTFRLRDGRLLGFAEWGALDGKPVFYFTSSEASRYSRHPDETILTDLGVHLYTFDRPGRGLSSPHKGRTLLDWADDVDEFLQHRKITRFGLLGHSQGSAHCLVCAYKYPAVISSITLVSSMAGLDDAAVMASQSRYLKTQRWMSQHAPWLMTLQWNIFRMSIQGKNAEAMIMRGMREFPASDQETLQIAGGSETNIQSMREALRQGGASVKEDFRVAADDWGFKLDDIRSKVFIWHGEADTMMTPAMSRYLAERLPNNEVRFVSEGGNLLIYGRWREILEQLLENWRE